MSISLPNMNRVKEMRYFNPMVPSSYTAHFHLFILGILGTLLFFIFAQAPVIAILLFDIFLCTYLSNSFQFKYRYAFYIHPIILLISSQLFETSFLMAGDGEAYYAIVSQYQSTNSLNNIFSGFLQQIGIMAFFKYSSFGVAPIFVVPEYFFDNPGDVIYYLWQGTFHVGLSIVVITLSRIWQIVDEKALFCMALFAVVSPSFFDLGAAPTRHIVTFFAVFLLFSTHLAVFQRLTISRIVWFVIAIIMVLISKAPLLLTYIVFALVDLYYFRRIKLGLKFGLLFCFIMAGVVIFGEYFYKMILAYETISQRGAASFSWLTQLPLIGWPFKYLYALLAPFPWSEAMFFISTIYSGNGLLFVLHMLSSLSGIYLFFIVILKWRVILVSNIEIKQMVAYALIMSMSILGAATGFHTYLLIYFPMLAPLLSIKKFRINLMIPISFVALIEMLLIFIK